MPELRAFYNEGFLLRVRLRDHISHTTAASYGFACERQLVIRQLCYGDKPSGGTPLVHLGPIQVGAVREIEHGSLVIRRPLCAVAHESAVLKQRIAIRTPASLYLVRGDHLPSES
jgi:hypothetical protein